MYIYTFNCYSYSHGNIITLMEQHKAHSTYAYPADPAQPPKRPQRSWRGWKQSRSHTDGRSYVHTPLLPHHDTCSADWSMTHSREWSTHLWEIPETPEKERKMFDRFKPQKHCCVRLYMGCCFFTKSSFKQHSFLKKPTMFQLKTVLLWKCDTLPFKSLG